MMDIFDTTLDRLLRPRPRKKKIFAEYREETGSEGSAKMEHFKIATANRHQLDYQNCLSLSAVNAVALAGEIPWEAAFRLLLNQSHRYGLLPDEEHCVKNMIREAGYVRIPSFPRGGDYETMSAWLQRHYPGVISGLAITAQGIQGQSAKRCCALRRLDGDGFIALDTREERRSVQQLFLPWREIGAEQPRTDDPEDLSYPRSTPHPDHDGYHYFQPNPRNLNIGDCVIRGYAAVFDVSWDESLEMIVRSGNYTTTRINYNDTDRYLTSEYGFTYHERPVQQGRGVNGRAFCAYLDRTCRNGERIFAMCGRCHVVGIAPVETPDGKRYAILDSWDSTERNIGAWFVHTPEKKKKPVPEATTRQPVRMAIGAGLVHPAFGEGEITGLEDGRATVRFASAGEKTFGKAWVQVHCEGI